MTAAAHRLTSLDGLRGLAAFTVVLNHTALSFPGYKQATHNPFSSSFWTNPFSIIKYSPLRALINGPGAVDVFFVLSGLVLAVTLEKIDRWSFGPYFIKRVTRIYFPFAFSICAAAICWRLLSPVAVPAASVWLNQDWPSHQLSSAEFWAHLGMYASDRWLDNPMWSLIYEMRVALFFPLLAWWTRKAPVRMLIGWGGLAACCTAVQYLTFSALVREIVATLGFSYLFVLGAALYFNLDTVRTAVARLPRWVQLGAWGFGLMLLPVIGLNLALAWCSTLGATIIVALAASETPATPLLTSPPARWLGRVSYSLYLTHAIVIQVAAQLLDGRMWLVGLVTVPASLILADLLARLIERPSMQLGRALAAKWPRGAPQPASAYVGGATLGLPPGSKAWRATIPEAEGASLMSAPSRELL